MFFSPEVLNDTSDDSTLWMPEHQASTRLILNGKQIELFAQYAMVSSFSIF
jgi:hypothetical protein